MNWRRIWCAIGRHDITTWRRIPNEGTNLLAVVMMNGETLGNGGMPASERHCKRPGCKYYEAKRVRARKPTRPANDGDTTQGASK